MNIYTIYLITNLINQKKYVGQTKHYNKRISAHIKGKDSLISKAINKYGIDNFTYEIIYRTLDIDHVDFLEKHFIKEHNSFICKTGHGYNLESGGNLHKNLSIETKKKISESKKGNIYWKDKHHSDATKQKLSEIGKMRITALETKQKMSEASKGKPKSKEHIMKVSESQKGIPKPQQIVVCPHCNKEGALNNLKRYHFDNCKTLINK